MIIKNKINKFITPMMQVIKKLERISDDMCDFMTPLPERTESFFFQS